MPDNGICERFHKTVLDEFYRIAFRNVMAAIEVGKACLLRLPSHDGLKTYPVTAHLPCRPAGRIASRGLHSCHE